MASLTEFAKLVGFFSYAREDDEDFRGELSALRSGIARELAACLGRRKGVDFDVWQDIVAIAPGRRWKAELDKAIAESAFFIPIVTPRAIRSAFCRHELEAFLAREQALGRDDLVFPILYIPVPDLRDTTKCRSDRVLTIVSERQRVDWCSYRHEEADGKVFRREIGRLCEAIAERLHETWISPEERARQDEDAERRAEAQARLRRAEQEARDREAIEAGRRAEAARIRREAEAAREAEARERLRQEAGRQQAPLTAAQERALKPGDSFREGAGLPEMIVVPPGQFLMGSPPGQGDDRERPQHEVTIARPFAVGKFAVTFAEWDACAAAGACRRDVSDEGWGRGRRPVINVSWNDAQAYAKWLAGVTGKPYRLLSEAEFEYAARAGSQTAYPWGDAITLNGQAMANCNGCGSPWDNKQTAPVGSFPANAFGLHDMVGNVWQWTEDCWNDSYQGAPADGSPWTSGDCGSRALRGGSWCYRPGYLRSAIRCRSDPGNWDNYAGFRLSRTF